MGGGKKKKKNSGKLSEFDAFAFRKIDQGIREIGNCDCRKKREKRNEAKIAP